MLANRVREFTTTVGTGDITLGGALAGHVGFAEAFTVGDSVIYVIEDGDNYEIGTGTLTDATTLARTSVEETLVDGTLTKTGASAITLSGGARIYCAATAQFLLDPIEAADVITEVTPDAGVTVDGVLLKDGSGVFTGDAHVDVIKQTDDLGDLVLSGGTATNVGANMRLVSSGGTNALDIDCRINGTRVLQWDNSAGHWNFHNNDIAGVGSATFVGDIDMQSGQVFDVTNIYRGTEAGRLVLSGGSSEVLGANITLFAENRAADANDMAFKAGGTSWLYWDNSAGIATFTGMISGNNGALLTGASTANARFTFTQATVGLSSQIQQGSNGFAIAALGAQSLLLQTNGANVLTLDAGQNATFAGDVTIGGDLLFSGSATVIDTTTINTGDNIIVLNADVTGTPTENAGIEIERGTETNSSILWNETTDAFDFTQGATFAGDVSVSSLNISNELRVPQGGVSDPSISFEPYSNSGIYMVNATRMGFTVGGVLQMDVDHTNNRVNINGGIRSIDEDPLLFLRGTASSGSHTSEIRFQSPADQTLASINQSNFGGSVDLNVDATAATADINLQTQGTTVLNLAADSSATFAGDVTLGNLTSIGIDDNSLSTVLTLQSSGRADFAGDVLADRIFIQNGGSATGPVIRIAESDNGDDVGFFGSASAGTEFLGVSVGDAEVVRFNQDLSTSFSGNLTCAVASGEATVRVNNTGSGDSTVRFQLLGSTAALLGVDNSDGDKFKIAPANLGTDDWLVIDPADSSAAFSGGVSSLGQFRSDSGSAAVSAYGFNAQGALGMYRAGDHQLGFSTNGIARLILSSAGANFQGNAIVNVRQATITLASSGATPIATADDFVIEGASSVGMSFLTNAASTSNQKIAFGDSDDSDIGQIEYQHADNSMRFTTNGALAGIIDSAGNWNFQDNNIITTGKLTVDGGVKISVQNKADGGSGQGIFLYDTDSTDWGIYMAQDGSGRSLADGTACDSLDTRGSQHIRFRVYNSAANGFIWENNSEQCLMSLTADSGNLYTVGRQYSALGTAASPSHSFTGDTDTGMYNVGTNTLGFSTGGAESMRIDGSGPRSDIYRVEDGDAGAPSYTFRTDLDTGAYLESAGVMAFTAGGTKRFQVDTTAVRTHLNLDLNNNVIVNVDAIRRNSSGDDLRLSGGTGTGNGGNFILYGEAHPTVPNDMLFRAGTNDTLRWVDASSEWDFQGNNVTGVNHLTLHGTGAHISTNTSDGNDNKSIYLTGGGSSSVARGGYIAVHGNEVSGKTGTIDLVPGTASGTINIFGDADFQGNDITTTGAYTASGAGRVLTLMPDHGTYGASLGTSTGYGLSFYTNSTLALALHGTTQAATFYSDVDVEGTVNAEGMFNLGTPTELTIASGAITITKSFHQLDTEANAATDDLETINGGSDGSILVMKPVDTTRTIVLKDNTGNLRLVGDCILDSVQDTITLIHNGGVWHEISRSNISG